MRSVSMDEVRKNVMIFQMPSPQGGYDLVIADEAWDIDNYWHELWLKGEPRLVHRLRGLRAMPEGGRITRPSLLPTTTPRLSAHRSEPRRARSRGSSSANPDTRPARLRQGPSAMREGCRCTSTSRAWCWATSARVRGPGEELRQSLGYRPDERVLHRHRGGSWRGHAPIRAHPAAASASVALLPDLRLVLVAAPRIDPLLAQARRLSSSCTPSVPISIAISRLRLALVQGSSLPALARGRGHAVSLTPLRSHFEHTSTSAIASTATPTAARNEFGPRTPE